MGDGGADAGQEEQPGAENAGGGAVCCHLTFQCTGATSQDGSSLEFIAPIAGRQCYIWDASGRGLCKLIWLGSEGVLKI